jgi:hypothetical protein
MIISTKHDSAVKLSEDGRGCLAQFKPLWVQFAKYTTSDSALDVCGIQSVAQVLDQQLTRPEEKPEEAEEVAEHKATFSDALKGLETARKYMCQSDTKNNITVICNKDRELKDKGNTRLIDGLKK